MKHWLIMPIGLTRAIVGEWHAAHVDKTTAFVGIANTNRHALAHFSSYEGVIVLPSLHSHQTLSDEAVKALAPCGVVAGDQMYNALEKVITSTGLHQVGLGEV